MNAQPLTTASIERVEIIERESDWLVRWIEGPDAGCELPVGSAVDAQRRLAAYGKALAASGVTSILTVDWIPTSGIGRSTLRAIGIDTK